MAKAGAKVPKCDDSTPVATSPTHPAGGVEDATMPGRPAPQRRREQLGAVDGERRCDGVAEEVVGRCPTPTGASHGRRNGDCSLQSFWSLFCRDRKIENPQKQITYRTGCNSYSPSFFNKKISTYGSLYLSQRFIHPFIILSVVQIQERVKTQKMILKSLS